MWSAYQSRRSATTPGRGAEGWSVIKPRVRSLEGRELGLLARRELWGGECCQIEQSGRNKRSSGRQRFHHPRENSKSSVGNHVRVQVPPSAPQFFPTVLRFVAQLTLVVKSLAPGLRLTLAELLAVLLIDGFLTKAMPCPNMPPLARLRWATGYWLN